MDGTLRERSRVQTAEPGSRITVRHADAVVIDTRRALVATAPERSPFFLLPIGELRGELRRSTPDAPTLDLHLPGGATLSSVGLLEPDVPGYVRLCPTDLRATGARWTPPALQFFEEGRASSPHARDPGHRVDVLPLSTAASAWIDDVRVATSRRAQLVLERTLPPRVYFPADAWRGSASLRPAPQIPATLCPYKGIASYFDLVLPGRTLSGIAWGYDRGAYAQNWLLPGLDGHRALYPRDGLRIVIEDAAGAGAEPAEPP